MDNLTHSLFGIAIAEAAYQNRLKSKDENLALKGLFYFVSIFANNFPDLDLLYKLLDPTSLGYLMHHRGFTHTLPWIWPQVFLLLLAVFIGSQLFKKSYSVKDWYYLFILSAVGFHVHVGLDFLNSYGVHPFVPFDNHWYYGDTLFIMEPLLWAILVPLLMVCGYTKILKFIFVIPCLLLFYVGVKAEFLSYIHVLLIVLFALMNRRSFLRTRPIFRPYMALFMSTIVVLIFWIAGRKAEQFIALKTSLQIKGTINDIILSPFPGNPFCWLALLIESDPKDYRIHVGVFRHKAFIGPKSCPMENKKLDITLTPPVFAKDSHVQWKGYHQYSKGRLKEALEKSCQLRAWFQFIRAPYITEGTYGDMRYALRGGKSFSTIETNQDQVCPPYGVPWIPPRQDLISQKL